MRRQCSLLLLLVWAMNLSAQNCSDALARAQKYQDDGNTVEAIRWFKKALDRGCKDVRYSLIALYKHEGYFGNALELYQGLAEEGDTRAMIGIGDLYVRETPGGFVKDVAKALGWYRMAAEKGNAEALERMKELIALSGLRK